MRKRLGFQGIGRLELQLLNVGKKLKLLLGAKGSTLLEILKKAIRFFLYIQKQKFLTSQQWKMAPFVNYHGSYDLNSFTAFSLENPFVAPTLTIKPTQVNHHGDLRFNAYPGSGLSFRLNAHYSKYDNFPLFKRLPYDHNNKDMAYRLANAYQVIYDSVEKMGIVTRISMRFSEYNKISLETSYFKYDRNGDKKVWNVPSLNIELNANFRLGRKLFQVGGNYIGIGIPSETELFPCQTTAAEILKLLNLWHRYLIFHLRLRGKLILNGTFSTKEKYS